MKNPIIRVTMTSPWHADRPTAHVTIYRKHSSHAYSLTPSSRWRLCLLISNMVDRHIAYLHPHYVRVGWVAYISRTKEQE